MSRCPLSSQRCNALFGHTLRLVGNCRELILGTDDVESSYQIIERLPHLLLIHDIASSEQSTTGRFVMRSLEEDVGPRYLSVREALASDRLEDFVRQEEARGVELTNGSDLERALALLVTQRLKRKWRYSGWSIFATLFELALPDCTSCGIAFSALI